MADIKEKATKIQTQGPHGFNPFSECDVSGKLVVIDHDHHMVHEGMFFIVDSIDSDVDIAAPKIWTFVAPNNDTRIHMYFQGNASGGGTFELFESTTVSSDGSTITPVNLNRNSTRTPELLFYMDSTIDSIGTFLMGTYVGAAQLGLFRVTGAGERNTEMILKKNTRYCVRFTPSDDNTKVSISFKWYECNYPGADEKDPLT